ncbi:hypothetical protein [Reichenbachiella sp.]|uniref:hypothetical protein n=1 Tax=Reichenbachiella sp. TaxID=2184521 RepID=UPI003B58CBA7
MKPLITLLSFLFVCQFSFAQEDRIEEDRANISTDGVASYDGVYKWAGESEPFSGMVKIYTMRRVSRRSPQKELLYQTMVFKDGIKLEETQYHADGRPEITIVYLPDNTQTVASRIRYDDNGNEM